MNKSYDQGREDIARLAKRFAANREAYHSPDYKEAHVRMEFIDPLFMALGWDVRNDAGAAPQYREVIPEPALDAEGQVKAPDYAFRIGASRKFFAEAKKPGANIEVDVAPAYQVRRYGWTAKLPLSILTDFEELAAYDCRVRPSPKDKASKARLSYWGFESYPDRWREVWDLFSREAIISGAFDRFAEGTGTRRGASTVDAEFLKEIEGWRDLLAHNIANRNSVEAGDLNDSVQRTIDRIIFLRMAEDRGMEEQNLLLKLLDREDVYTRLLKLFGKAEARYNSGLFDFEADRLTPRLKVDDKVLATIIKSLYYPQCPYAFNLLPADILGNVYEQFLGKVIRVTDGGRAKVEDKPEVKKAGGVYYTPSYIVDYIVRNTVGKQVEGKGPKQLRGFRVLDMACGSGSFLLGAYQHLLDHHLRWYTNNGPEKNDDAMRQAAGAAGQPEWRLTIAEKKRILTEHVFGVDIDRQAVEVTKLSLLLKVLEGETDETVGQQMQLFHERALPNLDNNIKCGNSLIGPDYFSGKLLQDTEEMERVNPFDWKKEFPEAMKAGGFDAVIGNPPYDVMEKERGASSWPHTALSDYVRVNTEYENALGGKLNLFRFFIIRSMNLSKSGGRFGMIVPLALLADISCSRTRRHVILSASDLLADCFPQKDNASRRVFLQAKLSTVIVTCTRELKVDEKLTGIRIRVFPWNKFEDPPKQCSVSWSEAQLLDPESTPIPLVDEGTWSICKRIHSAKDVRRLAELKDYQVTRGEINQTVYRKFISGDRRKARLLKGVEIGRFCLHQELKQGRREWFDEKSFLREETPRGVANRPRVATQRITGVDERLRVVATLIQPPVYFADSTNSICLADKSMYRLEYLLGLLNSWLFQWRFKLASTNNNVATNQLESLPIRIIDFTKPADKAAHDRMVSLVERMMELHKQLAGCRGESDKPAIERLIASTDAEIDRLVYDLYELTEDEIKIVNGGMGGHQ